jgi:hypothetical protein
VAPASPYGELANTHTLLGFGPGLAPPLYTYPPANPSLASISFLLVFLPNTLEPKTRGRRRTSIQNVIELSAALIAESTFIRTQPTGLLVQIPKLRSLPEVDSLAREKL